VTAVNGDTAQAAHRSSQNGNTKERVLGQKTDVKICEKGKKDGDVYLALVVAGKNIRLLRVELRQVGVNGDAAGADGESGPGRGDFVGCFTGGINIYRKNEQAPSENQIEGNDCIDIDCVQHEDLMVERRIMNAK